MHVDVVINKYNDGRHCADCKYFQEVEQGKHVCELNPERTFFNHVQKKMMSYQNEIPPSKLSCKKYEKEINKNHCECGCFLRYGFKYCPNCGKKNEAYHG